MIRFLGPFCLFFCLLSISTTNILTADIPRSSRGIFIEKLTTKVEHIKAKGRSWIMYFIKPSNPWRKTVASWYGPGFNGRTTACGGRYNQKGLSAAHFDLPCGTPIEVENLNNGRSITIPITDRGPFDLNSVEAYKRTGDSTKLEPFEGRELDLSEGSMKAIGAKGLANIRYRVMN